MGFQVCIQKKKGQLQILLDTEVFIGLLRNHYVATSYSIFFAIVATNIDLSCRNFQVVEHMVIGSTLKGRWVSTWLQKTSSDPAQSTFDLGQEENLFCGRVDANCCFYTMLCIFSTKSGSCLLVSQLPTKRLFLELGDRSFSNSTAWGADIHSG